MKRILIQEPILTKLQKDILVGYLLSDGCLEPYHNSGVARLKVGQSLKQKMFADWLFEVFRNVTRTPPTINPKKQGISFNTLNLKQLYVFYRRFYRNKHKIIPEDIERLLTPLSLSVWFMGDGSVKSRECRGRILNTHCFTETEVTKLCQVLIDKFSLISNIRKQKDGLQVYISAKSAEALIKLIRPHLLPYFYYKLPLTS